MANAFTKAQFMEPPSVGSGPVPTGAVKAGQGITISADGTISTSQGGGTVSDIVATNGIQGGGQGPQVFLGLLPPTSSAIGGVRTVAGSGISIDNDGVIRTSVQPTQITGSNGINVVALGGSSFSISLAPAGVNPSFLGGVYSPDSSLTLTPDGALRLAPATASLLGGVKVGSGLSVAPDGTLSVGSTGFVTSVGAGTGLSGGGTSGSVVLSLAAPSGTNIGGVYAGDNIVIAPDGRISSTGGGGGGGVAAVTGASPIIIGGTLTNPIVNIQTASTAQAGATQLYEGVDGTSSVLAATSNSVRLAFDEAASKLPLSGGTMTGVINFSGSQSFPGTVPTSSFSGAGQLLVGSGSNTFNSLPIGSEGQVLIVSGGQVTWGTQVAAGALALTGGTMTGDIVFAGTQTFPGTLPLSGGTMTGAINFAAGQTISGYIANTLLSTTGDLVYASAANTPARLGLGAAGSILAVNGGAPAWRTSAQLGLLTSAQAATTYATLNSPTLTGPVTINAGLPSGGNALVISGGNLVLSTPFTPSSSSDTGSTGEIAWDGGGYLYFCYAPNSWGRVQIDLTPF